MSSTRRIFKRLLGVSESSIKIKVRLQWGTFRNFAYLQRKAFAWKRNCAISSKLQML